MKNLFVWLFLTCILHAAAPLFAHTAAHGNPEAPLGIIQVNVQSNPPSCLGGNDGFAYVNVNGNQPPFTFLWSNGSTQNTNALLSSGTYTVTVTDAEGSTATGSVTVQDGDPILIEEVVKDVNYYGENDGAISLNLCGAASNFYYNWSNGSTAKDISNLSAGEYHVTIYDNQNCWASASITVNQPGPSGMTITPLSVKHIPCSGGCGSIVLDNSPNPQLGYQWTGPNGFTTNTPNPEVCIPGQYTVVATNYITGATAVKTFRIQEKFAAPAGPSFQSSSPNFCDGNNSGFCEQICPNTTVTYTAKPPTSWNCGSLKYIWTIQGAKSYTVSTAGDAVTVHWGEAGQGEVRISAESNLLCYGYSPRCVTILETPEARFASNPAPATPGANLVVCKDQPVWFTNQSAGATRYEWQFGDDLSTSTEENPKHEFRNPGVFAVTLIARSKCFCSDTTTLTVEVLDTETPLVECVSTLCPGEAVTYSTPAACPSYQWSVSPNGQIVAGGGPTDNTVTVQWLSGPDGILTLSTGSCGAAACPEPAVLRVPVLSDLAEIKGPERVCGYTEATYHIDQFDGTYYKWKIPSGGAILEGQGTPRVLIKWDYATTTDRLLIVEYENCYLDCSGRDTIWVKVRQPFNTAGPLELCANAGGNLKALFPNTNQALSCLWTLYAPDGNPIWTSPAAASAVTPQFNAGAGTYRAVAVPSAADWNKTCSDSAEWKVLVHANPAAPAGIEGPPVFCPQQSLAYRATGVSPENKITWVLNTGNVQPLLREGNPIVTGFLSGAPRWVSAQQVSANSLGCKSDTTLLLVTELPAPVISGNFQACAGDLLTFTAPDYPEMQYEWSLIPADAGAIKTGQGTPEVEVFWPHAGTFELHLSVCGKQSVRLITVNAPPAPAPVVPAGVCLGQTAPASAGQVYDSYLWKQESGSTLGTMADVQLGPGKYALVVTDSKGCRGTAEMTIDEYPLPNLTISTVDPTGFCNNSRYVTMSALTTEDGDFQYEWFRDNVPLGINTPVYATNQYGNYSASVTNQYGCKAKDGPITIFEYCGGVCHNPNHNPKCPPGAVDFIAEATPECKRLQFKLVAGSDYQPNSAYWQFGESGSSYLGSASVDNPVFEFPNASQYIVVLYAQLQNGALCTVLDSVVVPAAAQFGQVPGCPGDSTFLKDVSTFLPQTQITKWAWNFGEPSSGAANVSGLRDVKHNYAATGLYDVTLTVTAASGCTSSYTRSVQVPALPMLTPIPQAALCAGNGVPMALVETPDLTRITWDFGDPASGVLDMAQGASVVHRYDTPGNYTATVVVSNVAGCQNTVSKNFDIAANTLTGLISPNGKSTICEGTALSLEAPAVGITYAWSNHANGPVIQVKEAGVYSVTITDAMGCSFTPPAKTVEVNPAPGGAVKAVLLDDEGQAVGIALDGLTTCSGEDVLLLADANGAYSYQWSVTGTGTTQYFTEDRKNLLSVGIHTFTVTLTNPATGCTATTAPFKVTVNPVPTGVLATTDQECAGTPATVAYAGPQPPDYQYFWNNGEVGPSFVTKEPGHYFVRVFNGFGCAANSDKVTIRPGPNIGAIPSGCHRRCSPDSLCFPPMPEIVSWQWFFNGTAIPGANGPAIVADSSGVYWAYLVDSSGCNAQSVPLTLELYTGTGDVSGKVWSDVNNNGLIDAPDTLVSNIPVNLWQNGQFLATNQSGAGGNFIFSNIPSVNGFVAVDSTVLPANWEIVIGQSNANLVGCKAKAETGLLLHAKSCLGTATNLHVNACAGTLYDYNGTMIPAGQSQQFLLQNAAGCDSLLTVTVAALPVSAGTLQASACAGTMYDYNGTMIPAGQSQQFLLQNAAGCDSLLTVTVAALPVSAGTLQASACAGTMYDYNGTMIPAGQSQQFLLQNAAGCDSLLTVTVAALPVSTGTLQASACAGTMYDYNGTMIPAGQSQQFLLQNAAGCDSLLTVTVAALPVSAGTLQASACAGTMYDYNGTMIPAGQSQQFLLQNAAGCDSLLTVTVAALPVSAGTLQASACAGTMYDYNGAMIPAGQSQQFLLQNAAGCDSLLTVTVAALPVSAGTLQASACAGTMYDYNGTMIPAGQSQQFLLQNAAGCDSLLTVTVAALPVSAGTLQASACAGTMYDYNGTMIPAGQSQQFLLQNAAGCDSLLTVTVAALPVSAGTLQASACAGTMYDYNGTMIPAGQSQQFLLQNAAGCDSLLTVNVAVLAASAGTYSAKVCPGQSFPYQGQHLQIGETRQFILQNAAGCDSILTITVDALTTTSETIQATVCPDETYLFGGAELLPGETRAFHFTNSEGCDSTVIVEVSAFPETNFGLQIDPSCPNAGSGLIVVTNPVGGPGPYRFSLDSVSFQDDNTFGEVESGIYTVWLEDGNRCLFRQALEIPARTPLSVQVEDVTLPCNSQGVTLTPIVAGDPVGLHFQWSNAAETPVITVQEPGQFWVEVRNVCDTLRREISVQWEGQDKDFSYVYVPNAFAPEAANPENAQFRPAFFAGLEVSEYRLEVFDRWGNLVFHSDRQEDGWDGLERGKPVSPAVFVWMLHTKILYCGKTVEVDKTGSVAVMR